MKNLLVLLRNVFLMCSFSNSSAKTDQRKLVKVHFHFSSLIVYAMSLQWALTIISSVHPWENSRHLIDQSECAFCSSFAIREIYTQKQGLPFFIFLGTCFNTNFDTRACGLKILFN